MRASAPCRWPPSTLARASRVPEPPCGAGHPYPQTLLFNKTDANGYLRGYVPSTLIPFLPKGVVSDLVFPDTIVDFKSGPSGWLLEVQCVEALGHVAFVGINFYSKLKTEAAFEEMKAAADARG